MTPNIEVAVPFFADRHLPPQAAGPFAQALAQSGVVDFFQSWDQLTSWWPACLWNEETTPLARVLRDCDSFQDAFVSAAFACAAAPGLGLAVSTDALRRGPAELAQTALTLADATQGRAVLMLGAGEIKQAKPFGYKRSEGLARMEDVLRAMPMLYGATEPVDFDGNIWKFQQAWIGGRAEHRPRVLAMGGGPKLIDMAARYADGFVSMMPFAFSTPERYAEEVATIRGLLERYGRDPDQFTFGLWHCTILAEPDEIDAMIDNPLSKWIGSVLGRFDQQAWRAEGLQPLFPEGWHYALKLLPAQMSAAEVNDIVARTPRAMVEKAFASGTPAEVVKTVEAFTDAGATFHSIIDFGPSMRPIEAAQTGLEHQLHLARLIKNLR
jgi:phthiodiolone/phenolphthiodiolone dimycocerosates ketoreductase